ncbi:MAG TPA: tRNA (adenosine(37)-N6)-threonylcarbamoyltransferase complex dimerization subunit type 1 TsaB [Ohtaekwangia sp.]
MALILSIDTSTTVCSVALHDNANLLVLNEVHLEQAHASRLGVLVDQIKVSAGIDFGSLNAIAVSSGPGSYTGLRIGVSLAKGLCMSLNIPLISVETLDAMALQINKTNFLQALRCPMIDARRMEVYCKIFSPTSEVVQPVQAKVIDENSFDDLLKTQQVIFFGNGAVKCKDTIKPANAIFVEGINPSAREIGVLAFEKFKLNQIEDTVHFEPHYLKEFMIKAPAKTALNEITS